MHKQIVLTLLLASACNMRIARAAEVPPQKPVWTVTLEQDKKLGDMLCLRSDLMEVKLTEKQFWTIHSLSAEGFELVGHTGANGAVAHISGEDGKTLEDPWIGTGHGKEVVKSFTVTVDGKPVTVKAGESFSGREVRVVKESNIGPLDQKAEMIYPASGDRLIERSTFTAVEDLSKRFKFVYGWMHTNTLPLTSYMTWDDAGKSLPAVNLPPEGKQGRTIQRNSSFHFLGNIRSMAACSAADGRGIAYVYGATYDNGRYGGTKIWDRKNDNKIYYTPLLNADTLPLGKSVSYEVVVIPFKAPEAEWADTAGKLTAGIVAAMKKEGQDKGALPAK